MNHNEIDELRKNFGQEEKCLHEGTVKTLWTQNDAKVLEKTEAIEMAKSLITQFVMSTGMQNQRDGSKNITDPVFDDLHNILLAYKENKQRWPHRSIVVTADLIEFRINTVVDDVYFLRSEVFENLQHMVDDALSCLNFEKLVYVSDNEWGLIENTSARLKYLAFERHDLDAWRKMLLSTFPVVLKKKRFHRGDESLVRGFDTHKNLDDIEDRHIFENELAANFLRKYKRTDVRVTEVRKAVIAHTEDTIYFDIVQAFELSDGTHWLEDERGIRRVSESLLHCDLCWDEEAGLFVYDDEENMRPIKIV